MQNISMKSTIVHPLYDLQLKGGMVDALNPSSFDKQLVRLGKRFMNSSEQLEKDISMEQTSMDIRTFIPASGYHPVSLIHRGENMLERAYRFKNPQMTEMQRRTRPRYTLNPAIAQKTDEVFQQHIAPRLSLMDSEQNAYNQLMLGVNWNPQTLAQLPMTDEFADRAYSMLDAADKETGVLKGPVGKTFQQQIPDANDAQADGQPDWMQQMQAAQQAQQQMASRQNQSNTAQVAPFIMNRGPEGQAQLKPIDLRKAPNLSADIPADLFGNLYDDGTNPPIQADPGALQQRVLDQAAPAQQSMLGKATGVVKSGAAATGNAIADMASGVKKGAGGLLTSVANLVKKKEAQIVVDPGNKEEVKKAVEEVKNPAPTIDTMKATPAPAATPGRSFLGRMMGAIFKSSKSKKGDMMNVKIDSKGNRANVSRYSGLIGDYGTKAGQGFSNEDAARDALYKLMNHHWDGQITTQDGVPKTSEQYNDKDKFIVALYNQLNALIDSDPTEVDQTIYEFFDRKLDISYADVPFPDIQELTVGGGYVDPSAMRLDSIVVNAMHDVKLDYPANGGIDIEQQKILQNMSDQIAQRDADMEVMVDNDDKTQLIVQDDKTVPVDYKKKINDRIDNMNDDELDAIIASIKAGEADPTVLLNRNPDNEATILINKGDGENSDMEDEEAKMEANKKAQAEAMNVDKNEEVKVEVKAADEAIKKEKKKKDQALVGDVRKSARLMGAAPEAPPEAPPKKQAAKEEEKKAQPQGEIITKEIVKKATDQGLSKGGFTAKDKEPAVNPDDRNKLQLLVNGLTEEEKQKVNTTFPDFGAKGRPGYLEVASRAGLTIAQLAAVALRTGSSSRIAFVASLLALTGQAGADGAK